MLLPAHRAVLMGGTRALMRRNLAAHFDAGLGITAAGGFASQHADISGYARHRTQATGANQPIHLPFSGTKYGWLSGVAGNYFSTPDSVANSITGNIDIRIKVAATDWTPAATSRLVCKRDGTGASFDWYLRTDGKLEFFNGTTTSTSSAATGLTDGAVAWLRVTRQASAGELKFYTSDDGTTWTQLGTTLAIPNVAITDTTVSVFIGVYGDGSSPLAGKVWAAQIYNGIDGTLAVDFDPSRWSSGTTLTASTGETWTINGTGAKPAQIVDRPSLLFDGAAHKMATADFGLVQPYARILVARTPTHTVGDVLADGLTLNTGALRQTTASPKLSINAGASACETSMTLGAWKVITAVVNGASSSLRENLGTPTTGDVGAGNPGGLMIGADGGGANYGNLQYTDELIYSYAPSESVLQNIIRALMNKRGIA